MTVFSWTVRDRNVAGLSSSVPGAGGEILLNWSSDPEVSGFPWAEPNYPSLLILSVGFRVNASAAAATRRPRLRLVHETPIPSALFDWKAIGTHTATISRRYDFYAGVSVEVGPTENLYYREPLPEGLILVPGAPNKLILTIDNWQALDSYTGGVSVHGMLLY